MASATPTLHKPHPLIPNHIDTSHGPDEERHDPADDTAAPTPARSASPVLENIGGDVEKGLTKRSTAGKGIKTAVASAEERDWKDDIVTFDTKSDPMNPKNWPFKKKVLVTMLFGFTTMTSTFGSSVISPGLKYIAKDYQVSSEVATLAISLFILGYVPGPVLFAPLSEIYGRKPSVLIPMFFFICLSAATATSENIQSIMITRFFGGVMASAPVSNVGGGLADMFDQRERGTAVVFYSLAVVAGPNLGPIVGAAVSQSYLGWRWAEYLTVILGGVVVALDVLFLPETFAPVILARKARKLRLKTGRWALHGRHEMNNFTLQVFLEKNLLRPLQMIVREPMVLCLTLWANVARFIFLVSRLMQKHGSLSYNSFAYGILYLLFAAVPIIYEEHRGYNPLIGSLPFIGVLIGTFIAAGINMLYSQHYFVPYVDSHDGYAPPEKRLPPMMLGSITFPIGFFLLGWTSNPSINWFPSVLGLVFIGMSFLLIFQAGINYLIDAYTKYSASAIAANTFMRSFFAAALPLVAQPLFHNLGVDWACTLLGCVSVLLAGIPFLFYAMGPKLRAMSKMTPVEKS